MGCQKRGRARDERFGERGWRRRIREQREKKAEGEDGVVSDVMVYKGVGDEMNTCEICKLLYSNVKDPQ